MFILTSLLSMLLWTGAHIGDLAANFKNPPQELASHVIWGWEGPMDIDTIRHDLDSIKTKGFRSVIFEAGYHLPFEYLSDGWFQAIRTAVKEAKARDLKVWLIDEGKYPSGFAGGKFTRERPELRMKALVVADTVKVAKGTFLQGYSVPDYVLGAVAVSNSASPDRSLAVNDGKIDFIAGNEDWNILLVRWDYRTGDTRAVNNPSGGKDRNNSQSDYLSHEAVRQFIDWTHEQYLKYIGDEFGTTVLGFRGDEPDFTHLPWTPAMKDEFISRKGYDPSPYLGTLLGNNPSYEGRLFRADYWDVWSEMFSNNFFKQQADWCEAHGISYITHLNKDHDMPSCIRVEGDLFRDLSKVQVPGIDAIWNQIWPGTVNDFPKFASSVAHVYGKRRAFSESFAAYNIPPTIPTAKYAVDYQMARGINFFEFMFWMAGSKSPNWMTDPGMHALNDYTNRMTYALTLGKPGARIAVYYPTSTFWMKNEAVNGDLVEIARILLTHQRDFDWVGDDAFGEALTISGSSLENLSGQRYQTLIIPSCDAINSETWKKIEEFAANGGKVLFWGHRPWLLHGKAFLTGGTAPSLMRKCYIEPTVKWTAIVEASLPKPEMRLDDFVKDISYTHRQLEDGDLFFITNEGDTECSFVALFDAGGVVKEWNGYDGDSRLVKAGTTPDGVRMEMTLKPWESRLISFERSSD